MPFLLANGLAPCRQLLGVPMHGRAAIQHLINIHFTSKQLGSALLGCSAPPPQQQQQGTPQGSAATPSSAAGASAPQATHPRPAMLYFVFNRSVVAVVVAHDLSAGEFVAQVGLWEGVGRARMRAMHSHPTEAPHAATSPHHLSR